VTNRVVAHGGPVGGSLFWGAAGGSSAWPLPVRIRFLHGGVSLWLDPEENLPGLPLFCSSHLAARARRKAPPKLADGTDLDLDGRQQHAISDDHMTRVDAPELDDLRTFRGAPHTLPAARNRQGECGDQDQPATKPYEDEVEQAGGDR
jgi:hypothetical protein